jgi:hypothetical protein
MENVIHILRCSISGVWISKISFDDLNEAYRVQGFASSLTSLARAKTSMFSRD